MSLHEQELKLSSANLSPDLVRIGVIGCGDVSRKYLNNIVGRPGLAIVACADNAPERAAALAASYPGLRACSVEELLASADIDVVLNLTPPQAHAEVSLSILRHGKHVYSEKPLAATISDARAVLECAEAESLRVGVAPDTFLGAGTREVQRLLADGEIGIPISVNAAVLNSGPERFHPDPEFLYREGAGPLFDIGPYYITVLTALLGPIARVGAFAVRGRPEREVLVGPRAGHAFPVETATHVTAVLQFERGCIGTLTTSFDVLGTRAPNMEIYGTEGTLSAPQANSWGGPVSIARAGDAGFTEMPLKLTEEHGYMGLGLVEMASSIRAGRPHQAGGLRAFHVLEVLTAISESARNNGYVIAIESNLEDDRRTVTV